MQTFTFIYRRVFGPPGQIFRVSNITLWVGLSFYKSAKFQVTAVSRCGLDLCTNIRIFTFIYGDISTWKVVYVASFKVLAQNMCTETGEYRETPQTG
jgi:hypothetical protein